MVESCYGVGCSGFALAKQNKTKNKARHTKVNACAFFSQQIDTNLEFLWLCHAPVSFLHQGYNLMSLCAVCSSP